MKKLNYTAFFLLLAHCLFAQSIQQICPPNWWVGMKNTELQLLIHGKEIGQNTVSCTYEGVSIYAVTSVENPNYLFVDLRIHENTKPGTVVFTFTNGKNKIQSNYELKPKVKRTFKYGINPSDFIYLLMPDRFANGDATNDRIENTLENEIDRTDVAKRHGGDLQGVINQLDYIKNLGATATWCTPLIENNQPLWSYHGYAATNHYKIDPRYGNNQLFVNYVQESHQRNMKVVMDVVHNHIGNEHWLFKDLPMQDFIHQWSVFTKSNYRTTTKIDPYASEADQITMNEGWFDKHMPDLNQDNPFLTKYLIQNNIWWIEYAQIDAYRLDTYPYSDLQFLQLWIAAIQNEYPGFGIFGEVWVKDAAVQSYFIGDPNLKINFNSKLPGITDFNLYESMIEGLNQNFGWYEGLGNIYHTLSQDYVYGDASNNVLFLGNHDVSRIFSILQEDLMKYKMSIAFLLTMRGIPQWYYGDEIRMKNFTNPDGKVREDFPGGWANDSINKFDSQNLKGEELEVFNYVKKLANWRKNSIPIASGKLMQFIPFQGIYVYFRYTESACVMVVMNSNTTDQELETKRFAERLLGYSKAKNIETDQIISTNSLFKIPAKSTQIFECIK